VNPMKLSLKKSLVISFVIVVFLSNFFLSFIILGIINKNIQDIYQSMLQQSASTARYIFYYHSPRIEIINGVMVQGTRQILNNNESLVDLIKRVTGVNVTIFQGNERVATTIKYNGKRAIGTYATPGIADKVLHRGEVYQGWANILGVKYLTRYEPIKDPAGHIVGMLFVGMEANIFDKLVVNLQETVLIWAFISAVLAAWIGYILTLRIIKPIQELCLVIQEVAAGNFGKKVDVYSADRDVANLLESFSTMLSSFRSIVNQITGRKAELEILAITDDLTKLYNYRYFQQRLTDEIEKAKSNQQEISLIMIDIDYFKKFNDTYGHPQGDKILKRVAKIIKNTLRNEDIVVRYGGEEFAIVLVGTGKAKALEIAERIRSNIEQYPFTLGKEGLAVALTVSLGLAAYPEDALSKDDLIARADQALYQAKEWGRNNVQGFGNCLTKYY